MDDMEQKLNDKGLEPVRDSAGRIIAAKTKQHLLKDEFEKGATAGARQAFAFVKDYASGKPVSHFGFISEAECNEIKALIKR